MRKLLKITKNSINCLKVAKSGIILSTCLIFFFIFYFTFTFDNSGKLLLNFGSFCAIRNLGFNSPLLYSFNNHCLISSTPIEDSVNDEYYELRKMLKSVATNEKTVILTFLNKAWAAPNSIFDLFLESFRVGNNTYRLLNHLLVITIDKDAHIRCQNLVSHCYFLDTNQSSAVSNQVWFMSPVYLDLMWKRQAFLLTILSLGYNFLFTDSDIMWFRDPFPQFTLDSDFQTSCDRFNGNESDTQHNWPNNGFLFVRSNNGTMKLYEHWVNSRHKYPGVHEQNVFNKIKNSKYVTQLRVKMRFMDTNYFGGFCSPSKDFSKVCTMHANCCGGLHNKIADLNATLKDWTTYLSSSSHAIPQPSNWSVPNECRRRRSSG